LMQRYNACGGEWKSLPLIPSARVSFVLNGMASTDGGVKRIYGYMEDLFLSIV
jgi:hypothetical protein